MEILIDRIEIEKIETTAAGEKVKTYVQGDKSTVYFTIYNEGLSVTGQVESSNPAFSDALDGLKSAIKTAIKETFLG